MKANTNVLAYSFLASCGKELNWVLYSGASEHLASDREKLENIVNLPKPLKIRIAKLDEVLIANHTGEVNVVSFVNGEENKLTIKDVLIVSGLTCNLLSVPKLVTKGFRITFENGKGTIEKNNKVIAVAPRKDMKLYVLNLYANEHFTLIMKP